MTDAVTSTAQAKLDAACRLLVGKMRAAGIAQPTQVLAALFRDGRAKRTPIEVVATHGALAESFYNDARFLLAIFDVLIDRDARMAEALVLIELSA